MVPPDIIQIEGQDYVIEGDRAIPVVLHREETTGGLQSGESSAQPSVFERALEFVQNLHRSGILECIEIILAIIIVILIWRRK